MFGHRCEGNATNAGGDASSDFTKKNDGKQKSAAKRGCFCATNRNAPTLRSVFDGKRVNLGKRRRRLHDQAAKKTKTPNPHPSSAALDRDSDGQILPKRKKVVHSQIGRFTPSCAQPVQFPNPRLKQQTRLARASRNKSVPKPKKAIAQSVARADRLQRRKTKQRNAKEAPASKNAAKPQRRFQPQPPCCGSLKMRHMDASKVALSAFRRRFGHICERNADK